MVSMPARSPSSSVRMRMARKDSRVLMPLDPRGRALRAMPGSSCCDQYDTRHPPPRFHLRLRLQLREPSEQPRAAHGALEPERFVPGGAEFLLAPTKGLEERGALFGEELHRRVALLQLAQPAAAFHELA